MTARITSYPDGPLIVRGDFVLDDIEDGEVQTGRMVALCRCGRSALKPLCDGSHANRTRRRQSPAAVPTAADGVG